MKTARGSLAGYHQKRITLLQSTTSTPMCTPMRRSPRERDNGAMKKGARMATQWAKNMKALNQTSSPSRQWATANRMRSAELRPHSASPRMAKKTRLGSKSISILKGSMTATAMDLDASEKNAHRVGRTTRANLVAGPARHKTQWGMARRHRQAPQCTQWPRHQRRRRHAQTGNCMQCLTGKLARQGRWTRRTMRASTRTTAKLRRSKLQAQRRKWPQWQQQDASSYATCHPSTAGSFPTLRIKWCASS